MPEDERFSHNLYDRMYERAYVYIEGFAQKLGIDPGCAVRQFDIWLFDDPLEIPWLRHVQDTPCANRMWREAHRWKDWEDFSDLALRLISCATSESDAERVLSLEKDVIGYHGTQFRLGGLRNPLIGRLLREEPAGPVGVIDEGFEEETTSSSDDEFMDLDE
jgi:hypothetical protein